jgi:DNA-binding transcriptional MerR regulator
MDLQGGQDFRRVFEAAFAMTGGIYLSQLADIVGVPGATLQNWVKRGFVASPVNKRYTRRQTCRIILIALLRHTLALEEIAALLSSINNNLADESDDLIDDSRLYVYFCDIVLSLPPDVHLARADLEQRVFAAIADFPATGPQDRQKLVRVLLIMILAYGAWQLQLLAREQIEHMRKEGWT